MTIKEKDNGLYTVNINNKDFHVSYTKLKVWYVNGKNKAKECKTILQELTSEKGRGDVERVIDRLYSIHDIVLLNLDSLTIEELVKRYEDKLTRIAEQLEVVRQHIKSKDLEHNYLIEALFDY